MNGMEAMAVNVLSKMMGISPEQMAAQVMGLMQTMNELNTRLAIIEGNSARAVEMMEALSNDNGNSGAKSRNSGRGKPAFADASAAN